MDSRWNQDSGSTCKGRFPVAEERVISLSLPRTRSGPILRIWTTSRKHRHLLCSGIEIGAGVNLGWLKCQNLEAGRGYWQGPAEKLSQGSLDEFAQLA